MQVAETDRHMGRHQLGSLLADVGLPASIAVTEIQALTADSRQVRQGSLFFAVSGTRDTGANYIDAAVQAGAVAVVCCDAQAAAEASIAWRGEVPVLGVRDVPSTMALAASHFYAEPSRSLAVTGITGTNGKSTSVALLAQLQQLLGLRSAIIGTLGYGLIGEALQSTGMTTPDAISCQRILRELCDAQAQTVAMEVSSHALTQKRVEAVRITTAIFTNISRDHLDYHGDMLSYVQAKAKLFATDSLRHAVINLDDEFAAAYMMDAVRPGAQVWTYSLHKPAAEVYASRIKLNPEGIEAFVRTPWGSGYIKANLLGEFNLYNLLGVLTAVCAQGADFQTTLRLLPELQPVKGRMQRVACEAPVRVVIDYAHTPDALRQALAALRAHGERRVRVVFGCGGDRDRGKRPQMAAAAEALADDVIVTSDNPRTEPRRKIIEDICAGFSHKHKVHIVEDRGRAIQYAIQSATAGDVVLIAGKGHEDYQIIGAERLPFDDEAQARLALMGRDHEEARQ